MPAYLLSGVILAAFVAVSRFVLAVMVVRHANKKDLPDIVRWLGGWWHK